MNISATDESGTVTVKRCLLSSYVSDKLYKQYYEGGKLENLSESLQSLQDYFGRLIECLVDSNHIPLADVPHIIGGWDTLEEIK